MESILQLPEVWLPPSFVEGTTVAFKWLHVIPLPATDNNGQI